LKYAIIYKPIGIVSIDINMKERDRVILRRKEGWSVEKIYTEELGSKYDPFKPYSHSKMKQIFAKIFLYDPLINGYGDLLKRIEEVYNSAKKL